MESSTSKIAANVLIIVALLLISVSLITVFNKKGTVTPLIIPPTTEPIITEQPITSTTTEIITTSTSTATSTSITIEGFTDKSWTWSKTTTGTKVIIPKKISAFTIMFKNDGFLTGTTDCNNFFASYKVASDTLSLSSLGATQMFCEGAQEGDFMKALQEAKSYMIDKNNNLILINASGSMMFK